MKSKRPDSLHKLCAQALIEKNPQKMVVLFAEINGILADIVWQVNHVLRERERADRVSHQNRAKADAGRYVC
jgi:hypothetical protein